MKTLEKIKIRIFGPQTFRTRSTLWVSVFVFVATAGFVAVASGAFGLTPNFLGMILERKVPQGKVAGLEVSQLPGNCPADGLIIDHPPTAQPFPLPTTINPTPKGQTPPSLPTGQYYVDGTLNIDGELKINGAVEIYATNIIITSRGLLNANFTGNIGGSGGEVTHKANLSTGNITERVVVTPAKDGVGYCTNGQPGCDFATNPGGGGASRSDYVPPDGAGGGGHAGRGGGGSNHSGQPGGAANFAGSPGDYAVRMGSGGGGGYCSDGPTKCQGGQGGGSIALFTNNLNSQGQITANGKSAPNITHVPDTRHPLLGYSTGWQQASGGGGAGGGILLSATNMNITGKLSAAGGNGGDSCTVRADCPDDDDAGGGGGGGEVKVFHDPAGSYIFQAAVDVSGGAPGNQVKENTPEAGDGGFTTDGSCEKGHTDQCIDWNFSLNDYGIAPTPGGKVYLGAAVNDTNFKNQPVSITQHLDSHESVAANNLGVVYGDWEGVKFSATKDHYYRACYSVRAGADVAPMPWSNPYAFTETRFYSDKVGSPVEFPIHTKIKPATGSWQPNTTTFQATWGGAQTSGEAWMEFRTGSFIGQWFTGNLDVDDVGIFDCGTTQQGCASVSCNIAAPSNLIANPVQNGQFENSAGFDGNVWQHFSAAPAGSTASSALRATDGSNGFMRLSSTNYFPQNSSPCGSNCSWSSTQTVDNADFQLYAIADVASDTPCGITLNNSATGTLDSCPVQNANLTSQLVTCPSNPEVDAEITGPFEVCADQTIPNSRDIPFTANISDTDPSDTPTYQWSVSGGNPSSAPQPTSGTSAIPSGTKQISGVIHNVGTSNFTLGLDIVAGKGLDSKHVEHQITVTDCSPGNTPGSYNPDPSEDIHNSGRAVINPGLGTTDTKNKILNWREILGNLF